MSIDTITWSRRFAISLTCYSSIIGKNKYYFKNILELVANELLT